MRRAQPVRQQASTLEFVRPTMSDRLCCGYACPKYQHHAASEQETPPGPGGTRQVGPATLRSGCEEADDRGQGAEGRHA